MSRNGVTPLDFSIVVVNHNHRRVIQECLDTLFSLPDRASFEIGLVDNACRDGSAAWVEARYPVVSVHRNQARRGFAANANTGIRMLVRGRYVLLLNPDVIAIAGLLDRLVAFMDENPHAGIAAPRLLHANGTLDPNRRCFPTLSTLAQRALRVDTLWRSPGVRRYLMEDRKPSAGGRVDWVTGAVLAARRSAIEQVGLLDERYFLYWEDLDWCYRMHRAGWGVYEVPEARAIHAARREGVRRPLSRAGREQFLGALKFFRKFGWSPHKVTR